MDGYSKYVTVVDRFTRTTWHRKIGDGPWQEVDCSVFPGGLPPVIINPKADWVEETSLHDPREFEQS